MELEFNIIFTPGTVKYLQLFVFSLLKWSDCSFRLVANGCSVEEKGLLENLCQKKSRLKFLALPSDTVMRHGQALSFLQTIEQSDYFCFMDSDILATGDFASELAPHLDRCAGVFSSSPMWCRPEERTLLDTYPRMSGWFNRTETGMCLGGTYLAMYDNSVLTSVRQSTSVDFEQRKWANVPVQYQDWLAEVGLTKRVYDTGKLLNLLLLAQGEQLVCVESAFLQHIGGFSTSVAKMGQPQRERVLQRLQRLKRRIKRQVIKGHIPTGAWTTSRRVMQLRSKVIRHFTRVLLALFKDRSLPRPPRLGDPEMERRIELVTKEIVSTYEEFREQLV